MGKYKLLIAVIFTVAAVLLIFFISRKDDTIADNPQVSDVKSVQASKNDLAKPCGIETIVTAEANSQIKPKPVQGNFNKVLSKESVKESNRKAIAEALMKAVTGSSKDHLEKNEKQSLFLTLHDKQKSIKERCSAAQKLAKYADVNDLIELEKVIMSWEYESVIKSSIAESLGYCKNPLAKKLILGAMENQDDAVVRGSIRGLAAIGDEDSVVILSEIMKSGDIPENITAEAVTAIGRVQRKEAFDILVDAYNDPKMQGNEDFKENIINSLGQRDIAETGEFFKKVLDENADNPPLKEAVYDSLEDSEGDISEFITKGMQDTDPQIREKAAWAIASANNPNIGDKQFMDYLANERDLQVRKRLYQAAQNRENVEITPMLPMIEAETDIEAKLAGYNFVANNIAIDEKNSTIKWFNEKAIPELKAAAINGEKFNLRLSAVAALKKADTQQAYEALEEIASKSADNKIINAIKGH